MARSEHARGRTKVEALATSPSTRFRVPLTGAGQRNGGKQRVSAEGQDPQGAHEAAAGLGHAGVCGSEPEAFCLTLGAAHVALEHSCRGTGDKPGAS